VGAVLDDTFERVLARLSEAATDPDPWSALERAIGDFAEAVLANRALLHSTGHEGCHASRVGGLKRQLLEGFDAILDRGQAAGVVRADVNPGDLMALSGMLSRIPPHRLEREPEVWRRWLTLMLDGLRPEGAHPLP
jgi:hypothetical protein